MATDNAKMNKAGTMRKVLSYMKRYIPLLVISLALSVVTVALTLYFPILTGRAIDLIVGKGKVDFTAMTAILTRAAIIVVIAAAAQWLTNICNNRMTYNIVRDIRRDAFLNIEKMPLSYIDSHSHGDMVSRIIADVDTFSEGLLMGFTQLFTGIATIAGTLIFMLTIDVKISCIVVLITPLSLFVASFITKKTYSMFQLQTSTRGEQTALIDEIVGNEKVVQAFNHEDEALEQFCEQSRVWRSRNLWRYECTHRRNHSWTAFMLLIICQPVHQAVQRDIRCHHRASERTCLCCAYF